MPLFFHVCSYLCPPPPALTNKLGNSPFLGALDTNSSASCISGGLYPSSGSVDRMDAIGTDRNDNGSGGGDDDDYGSKPQEEQPTTTASKT
jgi:hypothetical protein